MTKKEQDNFWAWNKNWGRKIFGCKKRGAPSFLYANLSKVYKKLQEIFEMLKVYQYF